MISLTLVARMINELNSFHVTQHNKIWYFITIVGCSETLQTLWHYLFPAMDTTDAELYVFSIDIKNKCFGYYVHLICVGISDCNCTMINFEFLYSRFWSVLPIVSAISIANNWVCRIRLGFCFLPKVMTTIHHLDLMANTVLQRALLKYFYQSKGTGNGYHFAQMGLTTKKRKLYVEVWTFLQGMYINIKWNCCLLHSVNCIRSLNLECFFPNIDFYPFLFIVFFLVFCV